MRRWHAPPRMNNELHVAAYHADIARLRRILSEGSQVDERDDGGYTPLHWSCFRGSVGDQVPVIEALIAAGADPNALTGGGDSNCLILAAQSRSEKAVAAVLTGGALVDSSADGVTALMVAARAGDRPMVELLLRMGAHPHIQCGSYTAADYARYGGYDALADLISVAKQAG